MAASNEKNQQIDAHLHELELYCRTSDCTGKTDLTCSEPLGLSDDGFCTVRDVSARITRPSDRSQLFYLASSS